MEPHSQVAALGWLLLVPTRIWGFCFFSREGFKEADENVPHKAAGKGEVPVWQASPL